MGRRSSSERTTRYRGQTLRGRGLLDSFFATVYVDDFILVRVQQDPSDQTALDRVGLPSIIPRTPVWPGRRRGNPHSLPHETNWDTTVDALLIGYTINTHAMRNSITRENVAALRDLLEREWLSERAEASAQEVLSIAGKLWNLTFVVRAGRYFVWQLLRITGLHSSAAKSSKKKGVSFNSGGSSTGTWLFGSGQYRDDSCKLGSHSAPPFTPTRSAPISVRR